MIEKFDKAATACFAAVRSGPWMTAYAFGAAGATTTIGINAGPVETLLSGWVFAEIPLIAITYGAVYGKRDLSKTKRLFAGLLGLALVPLSFGSRALIREIQYNYETGIQRAKTELTQKVGNTIAKELIEKPGGAVATGKVSVTKTIEVQKLGEKDWLPHKQALTVNGSVNENKAPLFTLDIDGESQTFVLDRNGLRPVGKIAFEATP